MIISAACAVFLIQILVEHQRQSKDLQMQVERLEQKTKGQSEEWEKHLRVSGDLMTQISQLDAEVAELEAKRVEKEKILQARQGEGEEKPDSKEGQRRA